MLQAYDLGRVCYDDVSLERVDDPLAFRVYPADNGRNNTVPLVRGRPGFFKIELLGDRQRVKQAELLVDLPGDGGDFGSGGDGTPVLYTTSWWRNGEYDAVRGEPLTRTEGRFARFRVPVPASTLAWMGPTLSHCGVTVWVDPGRLPEQGRLFVRAVVDGSELEEKAYRLRILPALERSARPQRFHGFFAFGAFLGEDVPKPLYETVYDMVRAMGVTHLLVYGDQTGQTATPLPWRTYLIERLRADGGTLWAQTPPRAYGGLWTGHGAPTDGPWASRAIAAGKAYFANDDGYYRTIAPHVDGVFWDWEPYGPEKNPCWNDPATLEAFARRTGRPPVEVTTQRVQGELREEFMAFRHWQLGQFMQLWAAHVHEQRPDLQVGICQGSGLPLGDAADYRAYADIPHVVHLPMIYTSGTVPFIERAAALAKALPGGKIMPMTSTMMLSGEGQHPAKQPRTIHFDYLHTALEGLYGISHWPDLDRGMDMEYVWEILRAMAQIARAEPFLFEGVRDPGEVTARPLPESEARIPTAEGEIVLLSPPWDRLARTYRFRHGRDILVAVSNLSPDSPAAVEVSVRGAAEGDWQAYDPVSGAALVPEGRRTWPAGELQRGILFEVPPQAVGMLVISPDAPSAGGGAAVSEATVRARFEERRRAAQATGSIAAIRSGELVIDWQDMTGDGRPEIRLASPDQQLGLDRGTGMLSSWRVKGRGEDLVHRFEDGGACMDQFWWPPEGRTASSTEARYEVVSREAAGGRARVTFRRTFSEAALSGLVLEKTYSIAETGTALEVKVSVRNESPAPFIDFSYRFHNRLALGEQPTLELSTAGGPLTFDGADQPNEVWAPLAGIPADQSDLAMVNQGPAAGVLDKPVFALGEPGGAKITVTAEPSLLQVYRWRSGARYTLEWMYQRQRVPAGQGWTTGTRLEYEVP
jgi:hypothetical protein